MRALITGGFGLIGGRIAQRLQAAGHTVVLGSRRWRPSPSWLPSATVVGNAWTDDHALEKCCEGMDLVVHAAGVNTSDSAADPSGALAANGVGTSRLARAARAQGVPCFVYVSTAHVYAAPLVGMIDEDTCPVNLHPYATSHRAGEDAVRRAYAGSEGAGIVLRLSNAVGAPTHPLAPCWSLLVPDLCRQAIETGRLTLLSDGWQSRDFVPVSDVCRVVEHLRAHMPTRPGAIVLNVGAGRSRSVLEMAQLVQARCAEVLGFCPPLSRQLAEAGEQSHTLDFRVDRLASTGFLSTGSLAGEVDALLVLCSSAFGTGQRADP